jgi:hypothetical protein
MKQTESDLQKILLTIECQHRHYSGNNSCPAAKYLRAEWRSWAAILKREHPLALLPPGPAVGLQ